jgi:hypothetical protein
MSRSASPTGGGRRQVPTRSLHLRQVINATNKEDWPGISGLLGMRIISK